LHRLRLRRWLLRGLAVAYVAGLVLVGTGSGLLRCGAGQREVFPSLPPDARARRGLADPSAPETRPMPAPGAGRLPSRLPPGPARERERVGHHVPAPPGWLA
jgi:hypothetical protein